MNPTSAQKNILFVACQGGSDSFPQWGPVGRLEQLRDGYRFVYTQGARTLPGFRPFFGMTDLEVVYESNELFPLFSNRLLTPSRPEYKDALRWSGFDPNQPPDPISLLAVTEGRKATDDVEVFPYPRKSDNGYYDATFFLHGVRWLPKATMDRIHTLVEGDSLRLMMDFQNPFDRNAVAVRTAETEDRILIGYVPRYMAEDIRALCQPDIVEEMKVSVKRVNPNAPFQQRVLCRIQTRWPDGFEPCSAVAYRPIIDLPTPVLT